MTSLATIIGLLPMALKLGEGSESYAPPGARARGRVVTLCCFNCVSRFPQASILCTGAESPRPSEKPPHPDIPIVAGWHLMNVFGNPAISNRPVLKFEP